MKRKTKESVSRVYVYGLLPPTKNGDLVVDQLRKAKRYQNALIELELRRRQQIDDMLVQKSTKYAQLSQEAAAAQAALYAALNILRKKRAKKRSKRVAVDYQQLDKLEAEQDWTRARKHGLSRTLRKGLLKTEANVINDAISAARKVQRSVASKDGLYWGTYLLVESAVEMAAKEPTLHFKSFKGEGSVGVQLQGGQSVDDTFSGGSRLLQIDPVDRRAWDSPVRAERRRFSRTVLRMRIGSDRKKPIFAEWPVIMHREIPSGWRIKEAKVVRRKIASDTKDELHVSIESPEKWHPASRHGTGTVGVDIGWRSRPGGLRVAYCADDSDQHGEVLLDSYCMPADRQADNLQSIRDQNMNKVRALITPQLRKMNKPEWLIEATAHMALWKSQRRFSRLVNTWRNARFTGDSKVFNALVAWQRKDRHLWQWCRHLETKLSRKRREQYRLWAVKLATKYECVIMEDVELDKLAERKPLGKDVNDARYAERARRVSAVGKLRGIIKDACFMRGTEFILAPAEYTTMRCAECGSIEKWDQAAELRHECSACGVEWDQDHNAAKNLCAFEPSDADGSADCKNEDLQEASVV